MAARVVAIVSGAGLRGVSLLLGPVRGGLKGATRMPGGRWNLVASVPSAKRA